MRSILVKIIGLLLAFNLALWAFFLATDDFIKNEVSQIKNQLAVTANLYAKITAPILSMTKEARKRIEAIEQHIHPELPAVKVEYYLKF